MGYFSPAGNYMFKVNNRSTRARSEICSKLTIKTPEHFTLCSSVSIANFEQVNTGWEWITIASRKTTKSEDLVFFIVYVMY